MACIRKVEIDNFRGIHSLVWFPSPGLNCLIGPGDSGKSTILDAIDLCLGARRSIQFTDADFHELNVSEPMSIIVTIGVLDEALKNIEAYGQFLRGFNDTTGEIEDEPDIGLETVLCLQLTVESDLEPVWTLVSDRAKAQNAVRNLTWGDRVTLAPTRIGAFAESNLSWRRGSLLNRLTDEKADAEKQIGETLNLVGEAARELGIEPPRVYRRVICSFFRRPYRVCSHFDRTPPLLLLAGCSQWGRAAGGCFTSRPVSR
jgi:hypothetical protein